MNVGDFKISYITIKPKNRLKTVCFFLFQNILYYY